MSSVTSWVKSWVVDQPPEKNEAVMVSESILMELDYQIRELEQEKREKEKTLKRQNSGGVDYSWLMKGEQKSFEIPQLERLELEELAIKIKPVECGQVITRFRSSLLREPPITELSKIMRAIVTQILEERPKEESIPELIGKSLSNLARLRPSSRAAVVPIMHSDCTDLEMQNSDRSSIFSVSSTNNFPDVSNIDNLPV